MPRPPTTGPFSHLANAYSTELHRIYALRGAEAAGLRVLDSNMDSLLLCSMAICGFCGWGWYLFDMGTSDFRIGLDAAGTSWPAPAAHGGPRARAVSAGGAAQ